MSGTGPTVMGWNESQEMSRLRDRIFVSPAGQTYRVHLYLPDGALPEEGAPAAFVLDGVDQFPILVRAAERLARRGDATGVAPMVIAGIESVPAMSRRIEDFTLWPSSDPAPPVGYSPGAAALFADFLQREIVAAVAGQVRLDPARTVLVGHSMAGYFALCSAACPGNSFSGFAALSPSIWWNEEELYARLGHADLTSKRFLVAIGSREEEGRRAPRRMISRSRDISAWLGARTRETRFRLAEDEDHASTPIACAPSVLRFISGDLC